MTGFARRTFMQGTAAVGAATQLPWLLASQATAADGEDVPAARPAPIRWLESTPTENVGSTWGVSWPKGTLPADQSFSLRTAGGDRVPVQTWPIGYWPDGSLKWSACAIGAAAPAAEEYVLEPGAGLAPRTKVRVTERADHVMVDTGVLRCRINRSGTTLIASMSRGGREIARGGELVCQWQDGVEDSEDGSTRRARFVSHIDSVEVEQDGPIRAVVRITGTHRGQRGREWLPFTVRLYLYAGAEHVRMMHTFVFDSNGSSDFIRALGIRFRVVMRDQPHDRHVRLVGDGHGLLSEAVRGLTGLRRDPGQEVRDAQVAGRATPPVDTFPDNVRTRLHLIPTWGDFTLAQLTSEGFQIRKRTSPGHAWITVDSGHRAAGFGYVGGVSGGLGFGMRDFWQKCPTQLDVRGAAGDEAEVTVWLWSPDAPPMDVRFYHDGLGMDDYPEQREGLEITYEDYEPGFGTAEGIARTSELMFWALDATPEADRLVAMADTVRTPPQLVTTPEHHHRAGVFGDWAPVDRSTPERAEIEDRLDFLFEFHRDQVDQHHWYGFWDYGDVMHTYDGDRHTWRYDIGGYAWDNSELSPDLWLWYSYLRSGRADVFRMAEAMTRHTGETDVYHSGPYAGLGTRHNVQHWGCSAKQVRISTVAYRRFYYFLTADERVGDLMRELVDADRTFLTLDPIRKIREGEYAPDPNALAIGLGTDWGALSAAWLAEWERGGDDTYRDKLLTSMRTIGELSRGFFTDDVRYDMDTGAYSSDSDVARASHLSAVHGLTEICSELVRLVPEETGFAEAWLGYCRLYNASREEQEAELGRHLGNLNLRQAHCRLTAYAANRLGDEDLAQRAKEEFYRGEAGYPRDLTWERRRVEGPSALNPVDETDFVSTNASAQYGLAAIQTLALVPDRF
ncbi:exo-rhamnogalacturonan lyase family protein [Actinoalloteichus caeruleus]|uniref:Tat pathway signal sequence domain protein n=1 Tax=Actinoalloteichus caeruleus DSM 43889 TaxID=1120930 RepID=A0ABT1JMW2_ACTCY|nr:hypothetical protein [Actinoalloteichus caeruleus]MCP2333864.1 hypothetical protein [Actinoalloteichus caeruleus DSM 43889]